MWLVLNLRVLHFQTRTQADVVLDLSRFLDFSLKFLDTNLDGTSECSYYIICKLCCYIMVKMLFLLLLDDPVDDANGVYHVSLRGQQIMDCALEFQPSEVQTKSLHSFELRAHINALFVSYYHSLLGRKKRRLLRKNRRLLRYNCTPT